MLSQAGPAIVSPNFAIKVQPGRQNRPAEVSGLRPSALASRPQALLKFIPQKTPTRTYTDLENRKCQSNLTDLPRFFGYFPWSLLAGPHRERTHYSPCLTFISLHPSYGHDDDIKTHIIDHLID